MALDDVDRGILFLLQRDARRITTAEMAEQVDVSASTVRNRIEQMEGDGIICGYHPEIDYEKAGLQLHMEFICSAPNPERSRLAEQAREIKGVIRIYEVLNGSDNVQVEVVATDTDDAARINDELSDLGFEVLNSKIVKSTHVQPFDHFGQEIVDEAP